MWRPQLWIVALFAIGLSHVEAAEPQISMGDGLSTCLLKADGNVSCWGYESDGVTNPPAGPFEQISVGTWSACGVRDSGVLACWGRSDLGLLEVPAGRFVKVDAGSNWHCAIREDDRRIICWGLPLGGEYIPFQESGDEFTDVDAGYGSMCGVRADGTLACTWLGVGMDPPTGTFTAIDSNDFVLCAIRTSGDVLCWNNTAYKHDQTPPGPFQSIDVGAYHACGLKTDGTIACWGYYGNQDFGQYYPPPGKFTSLGVGFISNCALRNDGVVRCWGINGAGEAPRMRIEPRPLLAAETGASYNTQFSLKDIGTIWTVTPYSAVDPVFSVQSGSLPPGFSLSIAGQLEGTSSAKGIWPMVIQARDANGLEATRAVELTIVGPGEDTTPPIIDPELTGVNEAHDWYQTDVLVEWLVTDEESTATSFGCDPQIIDEDTSRAGILMECLARSTGGASSESVHIRRDATPPTVEITSITPVDDETVELAYIATDATSDVAFVECAVDDPTRLAFCNTWSKHLFRALPPGSHTLILRATDNAGNEGPLATTEVMVPGGDTSPPVIAPSVTGTLGFSDWYRSDVGISWSVSDPESAVTSTEGCDDASVVEDTIGVTFTCQGKSAGGTATRSFTIKRDTSPPDTSITSAPPDLTGLGNVTFSFTGSDGLSGVADFSCSVDGAAFNACSSPLTLSGLAAGSHTLEIRASDNAGNVDTSPAARTWAMQNMDFTPPVSSATFNRPPTQFGWHNANVTVRWNWTDVGTGVNPGLCTQETAVTTEGIRTVSAQCVDLAGNVATASAVVRLDKTSPTAFASLDSSEIILHDATTLARIFASDTMSGVATQSCSALETGSTGDKQVKCQATDRAGNATQATAVYSVVFAVQAFKAPLVEIPGVNVARRGVEFLLRWRLVDALGRPVTTLKLNQVKLFAFYTDASVCTGPSNVLPASTSVNFRHVGDGNYETSTYFKKSFAATCLYLYFDHPIQSRFLLFKTL